MFSSYMAPDDRFHGNAIEINAPKIVYLTIQGSLILWKLFLGDLSSLVAADLDYDYFTKFGALEMHEKAEEEMLLRFIRNFGHVHELNIGESCHQVLCRLVAKGFNLTPNMRFPGVTYDCCDSDSSSVQFFMGSAAAMETAEEGQNRRKILKTVDGCEADRISTLPESLIVEILSRLPSTEDAIRTGALSKPWKHRWNSVTNLIFKEPDNRPTVGRKNPSSRSDFYSFVDKTLSQCRQEKLKKFKVEATYDSRFESQVNSWIRHAINCNVEEIILMFGFKLEFGDAFLFHDFFFSSSCFTHLTLQGCTMNPTGPINGKNLRNLCFSQLYIKEDSIEKILSGSPQLETLELVICCGFNRLDITSMSVKNLVFSGYINTMRLKGEDSVEINAPNILSLTIQNVIWLWKLLLLNVSSLVEANLDYKKYGRWDGTDNETEEEMLKGLILNLRHVKELKIGDNCSTVYSRMKMKGFQFLPNMKFCHAVHDLSECEYESYSEHEIETESDSEREIESDNDSEHETETDDDSEHETETDDDSERDSDSDM
ncbi:hypothetical protein LXL04_027359 [Taraxacum kok-saghyz]